MEAKGSNKRPLTDTEISVEVEKIMTEDWGGESDSSSEPEEYEKTDEEEEYMETEEVAEREVNISSSDSDISLMECDLDVICSDSESDNIPLAQLAKKASEETRNSYLIVPNKSSMKGKNGHKWSAKAPSQSKRISKRNILYFQPGSKGTAREHIEPVDCFRHFLNDEMISKILVHTNQEIKRKSEKYKNKDLTVSTTCKEEILALIGLLIFSSAMKDNHMNSRQLFNKVLSGSIYVATMSRSRFMFLLDCLRFDEKQTRTQRIINDPFAPIRELWDLLIKICKESYTPTAYLTIDEQLLAFRGRCGFRMYLPNKPAKYGLKIVMVCDSSTKYMIDASPYLGKKP